MRLFSCKVRLGGSLYNEVVKSEVTIPEIIVLRAIHGADAVADIKETGEAKRTDSDERDRLAVEYGKAIKKRAEQLPGGLGGLIGFSGPVPDAAPGVPLPEEKKTRKPKAVGEITETSEQQSLEE